MQQNKVRSKTVNWTGLFHRRGKQVIPHVARLFLVSPFLESGFRFCYESSSQQHYINRTWNSGYAVALLYVLINILAQPLGALMILVRYRVKVACAILSFSLLLQALAELLTWDTTYFLRAASLAGSLVLLLVDGLSKDRHLYAGGLSVTARGQISYAQLSGPILILLMMAALPGTTSFCLIAAQNFIGTLIWVLVPGDGRLKVGSLAIALTGLAMFMYSQESWRISPEDSSVDFSKYNLFPRICLTGGLLMIISLGFGDASFHERRKKLAKAFTGSQTDLRSNASAGSEWNGSKPNFQSCKRRRSF